jgi:hypothetical protein
MRLVSELTCLVGSVETYAQVPKRLDTHVHDDRYDDEARVALKVNMGYLETSRVLRLNIAESVQVGYDMIRGKWLGLYSHRASLQKMFKK